MYIELLYFIVDSRISEYAAMSKKRKNLKGDRKSRARFAATNS